MRTISDERVIKFSTKSKERTMSWWAADLLLGLKDVVDGFLAAFDHGLVLDGRPAVEDHAGNGRPGLVEETIAL